MHNKKFKYSVTVFFPNNKYAPLKYNVQNFVSFKYFLDQNYSEWIYFNVYNKKPAFYIKRVYANSSIIAQTSSIV